MEKCWDNGQQRNRLRRCNSRTLKTTLYQSLEVPIRNVSVAPRLEDTILISPVKFSKGV